MVDAEDSKSSAARRVGSSPTSGTTNPKSVDSNVTRPGLWVQIGKD